MLKKFLFTGSLISLAIGFSDVGKASQWGATLPFGVVLAILGFIVTVLEKEMALYDVEESQKSAGLTPSSTMSPSGGHSFLASWRNASPAIKRQPTQ